MKVNLYLEWSKFWCYEPLRDGTWFERPDCPNVLPCSDINLNAGRKHTGGGRLFGIRGVGRQQKEGGPGQFVVSVGYSCRKANSLKKLLRIPKVFDECTPLVLSRGTLYSVERDGEIPSLRYRNRYLPRYGNRYGRYLPVQICFFWEG